MIGEPYGYRQRWQRQKYSRQTDPIHVLHVLTDEGMCTVGNARYTSIRARDLEHLRALTLDEDPLKREHLDSKPHAATRHMFALPSWHGAFDNYLWDIAGKAAQLTICDLIGRARSNWPFCYNFDSSRVESALENAHKTVNMGLTALKNHWSSTAEKNIFNARSIRQTFGDIPLLHDAASAPYTYEEALCVGRTLQNLRFEWFEELLPGRIFEQLQALYSALYIPILAPETLMHEWELSALWLRKGTTDLLRANARHGMTATLKLAHCPQIQDSTIELSSSGCLVGLIHIRLVCAIGNTRYYEYLPGGTCDYLGRETGLMNPLLPINCCVRPPQVSGWDAEWDRVYFEKKHVALL